MGSAKTHHRKHHTTKARLKFTKDDDENDNGFVDKKEFLLCGLIPCALSFE